MTKIKVSISESFRKRAILAIVSIIFFLIVYTLLLVFAIGLAIGTALLAIKIFFVTLHSSIGSIAAFAVLVFGILILVFIIKFIFSSNKIDRSHLHEITEQEEPKLFQFIREIVEKVDTNFPKKVFISPEVNAYVFYDSNFWSMFLPVRKNLNIGIGLINSVSFEEFRAILAHEFGHFSQSSMKIGSYVYNVNRVIYNMLYENNSFEKGIDTLSELHAFVFMVVQVAVYVVKGIQWILKRIYDVININYLALAREMEFHADAIAAHVAGKKAAINGLMRLDMSNAAYNEILNLCDEKLANGIMTKNIYPLQTHVLNYYGKINHLDFQQGLPQVTPEYLSFYNKSKLTVKDQWASHPNMEERIQSIQKQNVSDFLYNNDQNAWTLFMKPSTTQEMATKILFLQFEQVERIQFESNDNFIKEYDAILQREQMPAYFNKYYNAKDVVELSDDEITLKSLDSIDNTTFFDQEKVDKVYESISLENDIEFLKQFSEGNIKFKTIDYDGIKYNKKQSKNLLIELQNKLEQVYRQLRQNDVNIYHYFNGLAKKKGLEDQFEKKYKTYFNDANMKITNLYIDIANASAFIFDNNPFDVIERNMLKLKEMEPSLKSEVRNLLVDDQFTSIISSLEIENLEKYIAKDLTYFEKSNYIQTNLDVFNMAMYILRNSIPKFKTIKKRSLLVYMAELAT